MKTLQVLSLSLLLMLPASVIAMEKNDAVDPIGAAQAAGSSESPRGASDSESRSEKHGHRHHRSTDTTRKLFGKKKVEPAVQPAAPDTHAQDINDLKTRVESLEKKASRLKFVAYGSTVVFTVALAWIAYQLLYHSHAEYGDTDDEYGNDDESASAQPQTK